MELVYREIEVLGQLTHPRIAGMKELIQKWSNRNEYMGDLDFLNQLVWTMDPTSTFGLAVSRTPNWFP